MNILRKLFLCPTGMCPCVPMSDDTSCWGECIHCEKRFGFVDRATLRAYADAEYEASVNVNQGRISEALRGFRT